MKKIIPISTTKKLRLLITLSLMLFINCFGQASALPPSCEGLEDTEQALCIERLYQQNGVNFLDTVNETCDTNPVDLGELTGENPKIIFQFFLAKGLTAEQAAGVMGNIKEESGYEPQRQQGIFDRLVPADEWTNTRGGGWGLVQWTPGSKMINPVKASGKNPNELAVQLEFLWEQLEGGGPLPEKAAGDRVKGASTLEDAVRAFATFERFADYQNPNNPQYTLRIANARQAYDAYKGLAPATPTSSGRCTPQGMGVNGVECPTNIDSLEHSTKKGYFQMPVAANGEYDIYSPESQRYGSKQLVCVLHTVALSFNTNMAGTSKLRIGDLNASGHQSHYRGIAVDLSGFGQKQVASHTADWKGTYDKEATIMLGKMFIDTGALRNIWWCPPSGDDSLQVLNDYAQSKGNVENLIKCVSGHADHFHVDIKLEYAQEGSWTP